MLRVKKIISIVVVIILISSIPLTAFANNGVGKGRDKDDSNKWEERDNFKVNKHRDNKKIEELEYLLENFETKYSDLTEEEAEIELEKLQEELDLLFISQKGIKSALNKLRQEMRRVIRSGYSEEELSNYDNLKLRLEEKYKGIRVLEVDSIISKNINLKFEGMPPVIKDGRTLIPVAAIVKGLGAHVLWDGVTRTITIWMDDNNNGEFDSEDKDIIIKIGSNIVLVDGVEVEIDVEAEIMNNRTVIPLRFVAETFGLRVSWNPDDSTIELEISDTILTIEGSEYSIVGTQIIVPLGTTRAQLDNALSPAENGSYALEDGDNSILGIDVTVLELTDVVVSLAEDGYTENTYTLSFETNIISLSISGVDYSLEGIVITIPVGTTRENLDNALTVSTGGSYIFEDKDDVKLDINTEIILITDTVVVTAQDNITKVTYIVKFPSTDTNITLIGGGFSEVDGVITVPFRTSLEELDAALTVENSYIFKNDEDEELIIDDARLLLTDTVIVMAEDLLETQIYTILISQNTDTTLTIDGDVMSIDELVITIPMVDSEDNSTSRNDLNDALTAAENGSYRLEDGDSNILVYDETAVLSIFVIVSLAEDGVTEATYTIRFASDDTELIVEGIGFSITDLVITLPMTTSRVKLDEALLAATGGTYTIEDGSDNLLGLDSTVVITSNVIVSLAEDQKTEEAYTIDYALSETTLTTLTEIYSIDIETFVIIVENGITRIELDAELVAAEKGSYIFEDGSDLELEVDDSLLLDSDIIISLAQDGQTVQIYIIKYLKE